MDEKQRDIKRMRCPACGYTTQKQQQAVEVKMIYKDMPEPIKQKLLTIGKKLGDALVRITKLTSVALVKNDDQPFVFQWGQMLFKTIV